MLLNRTSEAGDCQNVFQIVFKGSKLFNQVWTCQSCALNNVANCCVHSSRCRLRFNICPVQWTGKRNTPGTKGVCCKLLRVSQDLFDATLNVPEEHRLASFAEDNHGP